MSVQPDRTTVPTRAQQHHPNRHRQAWKHQARQVCPTCEGRGEVYAGEPGVHTAQPCPTCNPEGRNW